MVSADPGIRIGCHIHADLRCLPGKIGLILTPGLLPDIKGILPYLDLLGATGELSHIDGLGQFSIGHLEVGVTESLGHRHIEDRLLQGIPIPVRVAGLTGDVELISTVDLGLVNGSDPVDNLGRS